MLYANKPDQKEARERLNAFWNRDAIDRPALYVTAKKTSIPNISSMIEPGEEDNWEFSPQRYCNLFTDLFDNTLYLAEAFPGAVLPWGSLLCYLAVQCGGEYEYDEIGSAWIKPLADIYERKNLVFNENHEVIDKLNAIYEKLAEALKNKAFINPPCTIEPITTLSLFRDTDQLCLDLTDRPAQVKETIKKMSDIYIDGYDYYYKKLKKLGYGDTSSWYNTMGPDGKVDDCQCDFAVLLSPDMFEEFVVPSLCQTTDYFDYNLYHLDGTCQMRFLDQIASIPRINGIQWNPETTAGPPSEWIDAFKRIQEKNLGLHIWCPSISEAKILTKELRPEGLFLILQTKFNSEDEAQEAINEIKNIL